MSIDACSADSEFRVSIQRVALRATGLGLDVGTFLAGIAENWGNADYELAFAVQI